MSCSSCKYLKESKKKAGKVSGNLYYCSKIDNFVNGANNGCEKYELSYSRKNYDCDRVYKDGESFYDDDKPVSFYVGLLFLLIIFGVILKILGY